MRPTMCYIDTVRVAGRKPTKIKMFIAYLKSACIYIVQVQVDMRI